MNTQDKIFAPGARVVIRDVEWLIRAVDRTATGGQALTVIGISELVKDKEAVFLDEIEKAIQLSDPAETKPVRDRSSSYRASLLYLESLLRKTPPTDEKLYIGHEAAMDFVPYQLEPAIQALRQPRQRILIADAVGLGKTLEAGILLSELIRRGKGKRILAVTVKSMLTQFQKELWSRFAIPLTRLDSVGIQRIRSQIPTNHNPFYYFDKAIISIDTLKQDIEYRNYIENASWDIIVIDEAQNVAQRGHESSLRAKLAKLLARRSDTLIMLSATPHDGKARSFAGLMNMLDPTAIADPDDYGPEDIKGLFIRRFKKDIQDQVEKAFKEREIRVVTGEASAAEEAAFSVLTKLKFTRIDSRKTASPLFSVTLEKSLFSSPAACLDTISNRMRTLEKTEHPEFDSDIRSLRRLQESVAQIGAAEFSKYQKLLQVIRDKDQGFGWTGKDKTDRLVIFTERIETLHFLYEHLSRDLKLNENQIHKLYGSLSDIEQQRIVEDFGKEEAPVRLLLASDVASEGINLHFLCYRMIHFDIPWSLMVFQQRNGRIDRYGQERTPRMVYLITNSTNEKIRGDLRILELLIHKDQEIVKNIGDPAEFMGVYDIETEENLTAAAIENNQTPEAFASSCNRQQFDPLAILFGNTEPPPSGRDIATMTATMPSLFASDYDYFDKGIAYLQQFGALQVERWPEERRIDILAPSETSDKYYDLTHRFRYLPKEIMPENGYFILSSDKQTIQREIKQARKEEKTWSKIHYLWSLHPIMEWLNDKLLAAFGRHEAPVLELHTGLKPDEFVFIISAVIPNRKSHPLIHRWFGVSFENDRFQQIEPFNSLLERTGLGKTAISNIDRDIDINAIQTLLPEAVNQAKLWMSKERAVFEDRINARLNDQLEALEKLKQKQLQYLLKKYAESKQSEKLIKPRLEKEEREIKVLFDDYLQWVEDTMTTEDNPYIQVVAVIKGVKQNF